MNARKARVRRAVFQVLAALAVGASGFASLGTSECATGYTIEAERSVDFAAADTERLVSVRFSSSNFSRLVVTTESGSSLVQIDPPPEASGSGGTATVGAPSGNGELDQVVVEWTDGEVSELVFRMDRGDRGGAFSTPVHAALTGESCDGPPALELRVDVVD